MSNTSARLSLPYLAPSQAQKHVTHNEALQRLDMLVQPAVEGFGTNTPPSVPVEGELWLLGAAPSGDWAGHPDELAAWIGNAWLFVTPQEGWQILDKPGGRLMHLTGGTWEELAPDALDNLDGFVINTSHDATNRLAVSSPATLLNHEGAGHQLKINKATAPDTASLLYQTNWSGRAEMGLNGSDDFSIKLSNNGSNWFTALGFNATTGTASGAAVQNGPLDNTPGRLLPVGAFGLGAAVLTVVPDINDITSATGFYATDGTTQGTMPPGNAAGMLINVDKDNYTVMQIWQSVLDNDLYHRRYRVGNWSPWFKLRSENNTTVDSNGFLKDASPIVRLYATHMEAPVEPVSAEFVRLGTGSYQLQNTEPLASSGWQVEAPKDANGNQLVFVETSYDAELRVLTITTSEIAWSGGWVAGAPKDIPEGRWVDLRFSDPDTLEDESA